MAYSNDYSSKLNKISPIFGCLIKKLKNNPAFSKK